MTAPAAPAWRRLAPGVLAIAAVLLIFSGTAESMVAIWLRSETFAHAFLVPPITLWLVWRRREALARITPRPAAWALLPMAGLCMVWLMGELIGVNTGTQFALVGLLVLSVPAVFGLEVTLELLFPLLFLFFAVPFGEFMVPSMMEWTADFTVTALQWSGIPVYREGQQFLIPTGNWSVVEACSGIRYLIASFMVGTLFAYLNFRSFWRRAAFMLLSLLVPIVANWGRAYLIVLIGHLSGNRLAAGVDHIIYGWIFFGLVIGAMFMIGARWSEPQAAASSTGTTGGARPIRQRPAPGSAGAWLVAASVAAMLLATHGLLWRVDREHQNPSPPLDLPAGWAGGWSATPDALSDWQPAFDGPRRVAQKSYASGADRVGLWVGYYRDQGYDHKLVSSANEMTRNIHEAKWFRTAADTHELVLPSGPLSVTTGNLRGSSEAGAPDAQRLRVWQLYWVNGRWMIGDVRTRLQLALDRLAVRGDDCAVIFLYTALAPSADVTTQVNARADALLARFAAASLPALGQALAQARRAP